MCKLDVHLANLSTDVESNQARLIHLIDFQRIMLHLQGRASAPSILASHATPSVLTENGHDQSLNSG